MVRYVNLFSITFSGYKSTGINQTSLYALSLMFILLFNTLCLRRWQDEMWWNQALFSCASVDSSVISEMSELLQPCCQQGFVSLGHCLVWLRKKFTLDSMKIEWLGHRLLIGGMVAYHLCMWGAVVIWVSGWTGIWLRVHDMLVLHRCLMAQV